MHDVPDALVNAEGVWYRATARRTLVNSRGQWELGAGSGGEGGSQLGEGQHVSKLKKEVASLRGQLQDVIRREKETRKAAGATGGEVITQGGAAAELRQEHKWIKLQL